MIGMIPILIQFMIEIVQIYYIGRGYFIGWNLFDIMFIISYSFYAYTLILSEQPITNKHGKLLNGLKHESINHEEFKSTTVSFHQYAFFPELKLLIVILSFVKLMSYIRIFENFGFLVQMIIFCVRDLIPFLCFYFMCLFVFTISGQVLGMEPDSWADTAEGFSHTQ